MKLVDAYIDSLPEEKAILVQTIRNLLLTTVPGIEERLSFKIPFYHYYGMFCYINAVKEGVDIGFCRGKDLLVAFPQLQSKERAIVATLRITHKKDIQTWELPALIAAAAAWNEEAKRLKKPMVASRKTGKR